MAEKRVTWTILSSLITRLWAKIKANFTNKIEIVKVNDTVQNIAPDKSVNIAVPVKISELEDDSDFITNTVSDLAHYYNKTQTYNKGEVDSKISKIPKFTIEVVTALPAENISKTTIYIVKQSEPQAENLFAEYIRVTDGSTDKWEMLGAQKLNLSQYLTKAEAANEYAQLNGEQTQPFHASHIALGNHSEGMQISVDDTLNVLEISDPNGNSKIRLDCSRGSGEDETVAFLTDIPVLDPLATTSDVDTLINSLT